MSAEKRKDAMRRYAEIGRDIDELLRQQRKHGSDLDRSLHILDLKNERAKVFADAFKEMSQ